MTKGRDLKPHIGIFGRRNNGKSSFINTLVGQEISIVSDTPGTTTDPVKKSIEIFGIGPVILVDTAGIDDTGELGQKRIARTMQVMNTLDLAVLIIAGNSFGPFEKEIIDEFRNKDIPYLIIHNKSDLEPIEDRTLELIRDHCGKTVIDFSTKDSRNLDAIIGLLKTNIPETAYVKRSLLGDLVKRGEYVLLITPIDSEAPEGRMILPQVMAIRDVLDNHCICIVLRETELEHFFMTSNIKPALAVTDSQAFGKVNRILPPGIPLTGFSVLFARLRGDFETYLKSTHRISQLKDCDRVLILESCTHHISCEDIGRVKLPRWIKEFTGKNIKFDIVSGMTEVKADAGRYALVIQCGGCMFTRSQVMRRTNPFRDAGIPVTNYGMAIAYMNGIFDRATAPFTGTGNPIKYDEGTNSTTAQFNR